MALHGVTLAEQLPASEYYRVGKRTKAVIDSKNRKKRKIGLCFVKKLYLAVAYIDKAKTGNFTSISSIISVDGKRKLIKYRKNLYVSIGNSGKRNCYFDR